MWTKLENRLALLELVTVGKLRLRQSQIEAFKWLGELRWIRTSTRRDELVLVENRRADLEELLSNVWPEWRDIGALLRAADLDPTERGWKELLERRLVAELRPLPERLNVHTATAQVTTHSKASPSDIGRKALEGVEITRDGIVRLRPNAGLELASPTRSFAAADLAALIGEVIIPQRALADGTRLAGVLPKAILLVENLGPYLDLAAPPDWLIAHVPGWNTTAIKILLETVREIAVVHFGDLDPAGVRIHAHLREARPDLTWFVPDFWREHLGRGLPCTWPEDLVVDEAPPLVREVARLGVWLEQEIIAVDERLYATLVGLVDR
jgi:hypothetical protein